MKPKQTRNRPKRPSYRWSGISAAEWRATPSLIEWAQQSPQYRDLLTLLINDRNAILDSLPSTNTTENCLLGRHQAYDALIAHFKSLTEGVAIVPSAPSEPDYTSAQPDDDTTVGTDFLEH